MSNWRVCLSEEMTSEGILTPSELTKTEISIQQDACFRNMDSSVLVLLVRQRNNAASLNPCENTTGRHKGRAQSIGRTARLHRLYFMPLFGIPHSQNRQWGWQSDRLIITVRTRTKQSPEQGMEIKTGGEESEDRSKTGGQQLAYLTHISGLWMQDETGVAHLCFMTVRALFICIHCSRVNLSMVCFVCESQRQEKEWPEKNTEIEYTTIQV